MIYNKDIYMVGYADIKIQFENNHFKASVLPILFKVSDLSLAKQFIQFSLHIKTC